MATMSLYLFVAGGLALAFAFACHVAYTTILAQSGVALPRRALSPVAATVGGSATVTLGDSGSVPGTTSGAFAIAATWVAAVLIGLSMLIRAVIVGRGPWGNMFEFSVAFAFGITAGYLFLQRRYPIRSLGFLPLAVAVFLIGYAATLPHTIEPLVPALDNAPLLTIHVAMAMISYGIFATAFGAAVAYLAQGPTDRYGWLPSHKTLDEVAYRAVIIGFPIFATMIILGSWWASIAWGRYWGWDPKETSALVTWLIYAVYLHARNARGWAGRPAAMILVIGFGAVLFTYFGNLYFSGLHAYSGLN
ncbi:MAG TPA: c-type cytochrome biogenesis protein CcsB [Candidatus Limnocylindrales bacterium]|jgi:cytochrome c-type biogenesis protein CcsB